MTDLTFAYKCVHKLVDVDCHELGLELSDNATRSNGVNLTVHRAATRREGKSYNFRIAHQWNKLSNDIKVAPSLGVFKSRLLSALNI